LANKTRSTFAKRQKELARLARNKDKQAKRLEKKAEAEAEAGAAMDATTEDPDLIGIKLGPQPPADDEAGEIEGESEDG
jgi:hypothetical protein